MQIGGEDAGSVGYICGEYKPESGILEKGVTTFETEGVHLERNVYQEVTITADDGHQNNNSHSVSIDANYTVSAKARILGARTKKLEAPRLAVQYKGSNNFIIVMIS